MYANILLCSKGTVISCSPVLRLRISSGVHPASYSVRNEGYFIGAKWLVRKATHPPSPSIEIKSAWSHTFIPPYVYNTAFTKKTLPLYCIAVGSRRLMPPGCTAAEDLLYKPWSFVVPTCTARCLHQRP